MTTSDAPPTGSREDDRRAHLSGPGGDRQREPTGAAAAGLTMKKISAVLHAGHDPESGMLVRVREWVDLLPWIRLMRVTRIAGSPPHLILVAVALALWALGVDAIVRVVPARIAPEGIFSEGHAGASDPVDVSAGGSDFPTLASPARMLAGRPASIPPGAMAAAITPWHLMLVLWAALVWGPVISVLARQGARLSVGRELADLSTVAGVAARRCLASWAVAILPLLAIVFLGLLLAAAGWTVRHWGGVPVLAFSVTAGSMVLALFAGIVAFGGVFAVPLGWAAITNEADGDPIDALSRGMEYFFRRPLHLALYLAAGLIPLVVVDRIAWGVADMAILIAGVSVGGGSSQPGMAWTDWIRHLPSVVSLTLGGALVGGIYLLLRQDAGGQEPEDLWEPVARSPDRLPELPGAVHEGESVT